MGIGGNLREPLPLVAQLNFNLMQPIEPGKKKRRVFFVLSRKSINGNRSEPKGTAAFGRPAEFQFDRVHWARLQDSIPV